MGIPPNILRAWADAKDCNPSCRDAINAVLRRGGPGGRTFAARQSAARGMVGGGKAVLVVVPIRVVSTPNRRECWQARKRLADHQQSQVVLWLGRVVLPAPPVVVTLTRIYCPARRQKVIDSHDNLRAGLKAVVDQIARLYGLDDADGSGLTWRYGEQEAGGAAGVRVDIQPERA